MRPLNLAGQRFGMSDLRERAEAIYNEACVMPHASVVRVIEDHLAAIREEGWNDAVKAVRAALEALKCAP